MASPVEEEAAKNDSQQGEIAPGKRVDCFEYIFVIFYSLASCVPHCYPFGFYFPTPMLLSTTISANLHVAFP